MLKKFEIHELFAELKKYEFGINTVEIFGVIMNPDGISINSSRMFIVSD